MQTASQRNPEGATVSGRAVTSGRAILEFSIISQCRTLAPQSVSLPYTPIEDSDISRSTNRFATGTTYDDAGNVTTDNKFRTMSFDYDANGRMVKATKTSVPDALSVYDASGMRVAEKVNDVWRFLVYDIGGKLVTEYGGLQASDEGGVKYLLSDWQGSTRAVLSNTGVVNGRADYTAFGEDIGAGTGLRTTTQGFGNANNPRQKYGLTERDDATGMDHTWFRKHENRSGRWTGVDPYNGSAGIGDPQSFNRYSYVQSQPTNFVDPSGLKLRYYDVWAGQACVFRDGAYHCTEFIERYWYDDGFGGDFGGTFEGGEHGLGGGEGGSFLEHVDRKMLNTCLEMLYGLKAEKFGVSVVLSMSGNLSTTYAGVTLEANFVDLEPGAKPVSELKKRFGEGMSFGRGEISLSRTKRDKVGDLDAMLLALGEALLNPDLDVGNFEYGAESRVKKPATPSKLQDCYRMYVPKP